MRNGIATDKRNVIAKKYKRKHKREWGAIPIFFVNKFGCKLSFIYI
jgi:hypothetical protein